MFLCENKSLASDENRDYESKKVTVSQKIAFITACLTYLRPLPMRVQPHGLHVLHDAREVGRVRA